MANYNSIQQALDTALQTIADLPTFYSENQIFPVQSGTSWCTATFATSPPKLMGIGNNPPLQLMGNYIVNLFSPVNQGYATQAALADEIINMFNPGALFTLNDVLVYVDLSYKSASTRYEKASFQTTIMVKWHSFV
jgi:hypothetical protein